MKYLLQLISAYVNTVVVLSARIDNGKEITREEAKFLREDMVNRYYEPINIEHGKLEALEVDNYQLQSTLDSFELSKTR